MRAFRLGAVEFTLKLDAPKVAAIRTLCGIDLADQGCSQFERLTSDVVLAQQVLWRLCANQASAKGVTEDAFYTLLAECDGAAENAGYELMEAIIDFFPYSQQKETLRRMLATNREAMQATSAAVLERIETANIAERLKKQALANFDKMLDQMLGSMPLPSATDSPE